MEWWERAMSEFKFACPVCRQHITADSSATGTELECPTCFQKIVVPQAPASEDTKFILSASRPAKPRRFRFIGAPESSSNERPVRRSAVPAIGLLLAVLCAGAGVLLLGRGKGVNRDEARAKGSTNPAPIQASAPRPKSPYSIPTNILWTMDLTNAVIPEAVVVGQIHDSGFQCERATLSGGTLSLRQGRTPLPDLGISIELFAPRSEGLSGKTVVVAPTRPPPVPRVTLRWKDERGQAAQEYVNHGYVMSLTFGRITNGHMPGRIYIALPDGSKSFAAGTFDAEIRQQRARGRGPGR
jgi:hypothetical protein